MGRDLADQYQEARDVFKEADEALGWSLSGLIFDGPDSELTLTAHAQPAILTTSIAAYRAAESVHGALAPKFFAGHSLGEYTALVASGVLKLGDAVRLVARRGELMQSEVPEGHGAMAAILGMSASDVEQVCADAAQGAVVAAANINTPAQIVISGEAAAVERASKMAIERGAAKAVPLKVSAPFHCSLMRPVADELKAEFDKIEWREPSAPIVANLTAEPLTSPDAIREALYGQTFSAVRWSDDVLAIKNGGVSTFIEFGPGNVLTGMMKRIDRAIKAASVAHVSDMEGAFALIGG